MVGAWYAQRMASKFLIDVKIPKQKTKPARVRVIDDDQDETTGWVDAPLALRGQPLPVILAAVYGTSEEVRDMLEVAREVAYAVYLNDNSFDVHAFIEQASALAASATLDESLPSPGTVLPKSPRM